MKIGLVFAGQGAQHTGMGKDLYDHSPAARKVMDAAGEKIKGWCFEGTKEMLRQTNITQPCIYTVNMAAYEAFREAVEKLNESQAGKFEIASIAGFSLGEYSALTAAGTIDDIEKGINIVIQRGNLMNHAGLNAEGEPKGSMSAAFGERAAILEIVEEARGEGILCAANFNSPVQTVVAGDREALASFKRLGAAKGIKVIPLTVGTAFHSPMMEPAAMPLREILLDAALKKPNQKVYSNVTARDMMEGAGEQTGEFIAELMARQAMSPVYWQEIIESMVAEGVDVVVEIGPGKTLCGIVKKIAGRVITANVENMESLEKTMSLLTQ